MSLFTVLGASGHIGRRLVPHLQDLGHEVFAPTRGERSWQHRELGHLIYAVGLTADFRTRPFDTVQAHVGLLSEVLEQARFDSFLYLSSTRVYAGLAQGHEEAVLQASPSDPSDLYNLSKMMGESLCLTAGGASTRVVRLSNVVGADSESSSNFIPTLWREARSGHVHLQSALDSAKDYVHIADVVALLPRIAQAGQHRLYNLARGEQITHRQWVAHLREHTGCEVSVAPHAPTLRFPPICIARLRAEFSAPQRDVMALHEELAA